MIVVVNPAHYRPAEVEMLVGNANKARAQLGWKPNVDLPGLVAMMAEADDRRVRNGSVTL
jgi:GDPmannose 4,6-dehydratase